MSEGEIYDDGKCVRSSTSFYLHTYLFMYIHDIVYLIN